jgi:uncharacterized membrane protein
MLWNLFLAAVPAVLALLLFAPPFLAVLRISTFRSSARRGIGWWLGFAAWVLFLPNAPYLLTDVVHMVHDIKHAPTDTWAYVVMVTYGVLFACGLVSYALSLELFRRFLHRTVRSRLVAPTILFVHALCVLAMYLGRFIRLNSWDVLVAPGTVVSSVLHVPRPTTVVVLAVMFAVVGAGVFVTLAIADKVFARARRLL